MQPDEFTWIDSVPARPARAKRIIISEYEWARAAPAAGEASRLSYRFWINSTEILAILVEETSAHGSSVDQKSEPTQPRVRIGGRSYLLFVEGAAHGPLA